MTTVSSTLEKLEDLEDPNFRFKGLITGKLYCLNTAISRSNPILKNFGVTLCYNHNGNTHYSILRDKEGVVLLTEKSLTIKGRYRLDLIYKDKLYYVEFDKNSEWDRCLKKIKPL